MERETHLLVRDPPLSARRGGVWEVLAAATPIPVSIKGGGHGQQQEGAVLGQSAAPGATQLNPMNQVLTAVVIGSQCCVSISKIEGLTADTVIAVAGTEMILYRDIQVNKLGLRFRYAVQCGRLPETAEDNERLTHMKLKKEKSRLLRRIREVIRRRWIIEFKISATPEETAARVQQLLPGRPAIEKWIAFNNALWQALEAVERERMSEQEAFDAFLTGDLSSPEWCGVRRSRWMGEGTSQPLRLKEVTPGDFDQFLILQARAEVVEEKLKKKITALLVEEDQELREHDLTLNRADKDGLATSKARDPCYLERMHRKWWQQQYAAATIEIFEQSFAEVKEMLLSPVQPFSETGIH